MVAAKRAAAARKEVLPAKNPLNAPHRVTSVLAVSLADWVAHYGLSNDHFWRDDRRQGAKRKRLRGKTRPEEADEFVPDDGIEEVPY